MSTRTLLSAPAVVSASLLLGGLTSWAQGALPAELSSFANSASGWTVLTVLLVAAFRPSVAWGAFLGAASFVSLVLGYTIASELRGLSYDPMFWAVVGLLAGPLVGASATALVGRHAGAAAAGALVLGAVLVADGLHGLTVVGDTTSPVYWTLCLVAAAVLLTVAGGRLLRGTLVR